MAGSGWCQRQAGGLGFFHLLDCRLSVKHWPRGRFGYWIPEKPWRWGLAVMLVQALVLITSGSDFGLLPLGLIVFLILALPAVGFAAFMVKFRLRSRKF